MSRYETGTIRGPKQGVAVRQALRRTSRGGLSPRVPTVAVSHDHRGCERRSGVPPRRQSTGKRIWQPCRGNRDRQARTVIAGKIFGASPGVDAAQRNRLTRRRPRMSDTTPASGDRRQPGAPPPSRRKSRVQKVHETLRPTSPACRALGGERPGRCPPRPAWRGARRHVPSHAKGPPDPGGPRAGERQPGV